MGLFSYTEVKDLIDKGVGAVFAKLGINTGSDTVPVYINSEGVATAISSYSGNASSATKATQDGSGNVITDTYLTKTELNTRLGDTTITAWDNIDTTT